MPLSTDRLHASLEADTSAIAAIVAEQALSLPIPTCPEWTLKQLATHVGRAHRWAA
ncbi:MAG: maleylpyruvate isomerase N-terminal domain-containing protein, partial [Trebonia sp.]